jgi:hypothetical protein
MKGVVDVLNRVASAIDLKPFIVMVSRIGAWPLERSRPFALFSRLGMLLHRAEPTCFTA